MRTAAGAAAVIVLCLFPCGVAAQDGPIKKMPNGGGKQDGAGHVHPDDLGKQLADNKMNLGDVIWPITALCGGILLLGVLIAASLVWLRYKQTIPDEYFFKGVVIVLVLTLGALLVVAGYGQNQIAPVLGLFGTVLGWLLSKQPEAAAPRSK
jgi:hypothetical protein